MTMSEHDASADSSHPIYPRVRLQMNMPETGDRVVEMRRSMFATLKNEGFGAVAALIEGEQEPGSINGVQPDLIGFNEKGIGVVVQVETCETIRTLAAEERLTSLVLVKAQGHEYRLLVPTECMHAALEWIGRMGLDEDVVWEYF